MFMSESEIRDSYRSAQNKKAQVSILAELNACRVSEIQTVLRDAGLLETKEARREKKEQAAEVEQREQEAVPMAPQPSRIPRREYMNKVTNAEAEKKKVSRLEKEDMKLRERMYREGASDERIAVALGCEASAVAKWRSNNRLPKNGARKKRGHEDTDALITEAIAQITAEQRGIVQPPKAAVVNADFDAAVDELIAEVKVRKNEAKADAGKLRLSLVPVQAIRDIAQVREYGNAKYGSIANWRSVEVTRYIDALYRHLLEIVENPRSIDEESGIEHYKHIACNAAFLCELLKDRK